ncbi:unnamed protein product [Amoebophrya sp. A25]|nr:unnamed protein product [Amoebophrya sp. A25]|eukprot:GSA25T00000832001.1
MIMTMNRGACWRGGWCGGGRGLRFAIEQARIDQELYETAASQYDGQRGMFFEDEEDYYYNRGGSFYSMASNFNGSAIPTPRGGLIRGAGRAGFGARARGHPEEEEGEQAGIFVDLLRRAEALKGADRSSVDHHCTSIKKQRRSTVSFLVDAFDGNGKNAPSSSAKPSNSTSSSSTGSHPAHGRKSMGVNIGVSSRRQRQMKTKTSRFFRHARTTPSTPRERHQHPSIGPQRIGSSSPKSNTTSTFQAPPGWIPHAIPNERIISEENYRNSDENHRFGCPGSRQIQHTFCSILREASTASIPK